MKLYQVLWKGPARDVGSALKHSNAQRLIAYAIDDETQIDTFCSTSFLTRPRSLLFGNQTGAGPLQKPLARVFASMQLPIEYFFDIKLV